MRSVTVSCVVWCRDTMANTLESRRLSETSNEPVTRLEEFRALAMVALGATVMVLPFIWGPPTVKQLVRVEGPLVSYSLHQTGGRSPDLLPVQNRRLSRSILERGVAEPLRNAAEWPHRCHGERHVRARSPSFQAEGRRCGEVLRSLY